LVLRQVTQKSISAMLGPPKFSELNFLHQLDHALY